MTTDQWISQLVSALRDMTPTQHTSSCMEHEGGVVDGPDGRRVGVGPLVVGTCQCPERVQAARAALDAAALDEQEPDAFRRFRHCLEFDEAAPIEAVIEAAIQRLDYDLHLVGENSRLRHAALEVLSWSLNDMTALLTNPPQNAALFHAQRVLRKAMGD